jgi:hypothetical protein
MCSTPLAFELQVAIIPFLPVTVGGAETALSRWRRRSYTQQISRILALFDNREEIVRWLSLIRCARA